MSAEARFVSVTTRTFVPSQLARFGDPALRNGSDLERKVRHCHVGNPERLVDQVLGEMSVECVRRERRHDSARCREQILVSCLKGRG